VSEQKSLPTPVMTLENVRVVWPEKPLERAATVKDPESAQKFLHRLRRQLQVYEFDIEKAAPSHRLGVAGLAAALLVTAIPGASVLASQATTALASGSADTGPGIQLTAHNPEQSNVAPVEPEYRISARIGQEGLLQERPELAPPLATEFDRAVRYATPPAPVAPATAAPADGLQAPPAVVTGEVPATPEVTLDGALPVGPEITFNAERHRAQEYIAPPAPRPSTSGSSGSAYYRGSYSRNYIVDLIYRYFPASQADFAVRVAYCESGFNPNALGDQGRARGIFQFWQATFLETNIGARNGWDAAFNPEVNIAAAAEKVARDGWRAWTCARKV
jgi:hypothetical protein